MVAYFSPDCARIDIHKTFQFPVYCFQYFIHFFYSTAYSLYKNHVVSVHRLDPGIFNFDEGAF